MTGKDKPARKSIRGRLLAAVFAGLAVVLVGLHIFLDTQFSALREKTYDLYQASAPIPLDFSQVAVVTIDEASLRTFGRWPWPRSEVGKVVDAIAESGVAAVSEASLREIVAAPAEDVDALIEREVSEARRLMEARKPRSREQAALGRT